MSDFDGRASLRRARRWTLIVSVVVATVFALRTGHQYAHGLSLVVRAADIQGVWRRAADFDAVAVHERLIDVPGVGAATAARVYTPAATPRHTVLIVSGLHAAGIDEPRLVSLARKLAQARVMVVTPDIAELRRFEISPALTDRIEQVTSWLAVESGLATSGRVGLVGISFSGGLSVVAAGRPSLRDRLLYVLSFGGHDDLGRVLAYLCGGSAGDGPPPHDYGLAVVLLNVADGIVPPEQAEALREAVRHFLWASHLDVVDKSAAQREFATLRGVAAALPEPSATLMGYVNDRDVGRLGPRLQPYLARYVEQAALSPARSPVPSAPVFLLHGRDDNVIPARESEDLAARLLPHVPVRLLLTAVISHAAADRPAHAIDVIRLAGFWGDLLDQ